jgi:hypothetical protein
MTAYDLKACRGLANTVAGKAASTGEPPQYNRFRVRAGQRVPADAGWTPISPPLVRLSDPLGGHHHQRR